MKDLFEKHKVVRRLALLWAIWLITVVVLRITDDIILFTLASTSGASLGVIATSVIGILTVVVGLYQVGRQKDKD